MVVVFTDGMSALFLEKVVYDVWDDAFLVSALSDDVGWVEVGLKRRA